MMDTSGDNRISKEEFETHFENLGVEPNLALFKRDDTNSDGFIAFEEFGLNRQNNNLFAQLDADGNQELTREEFQVEWHTVSVLSLCCAVQCSVCCAVCVCACPHGHRPPSRPNRAREPLPNFIGCVMC